MQYGQAPGKFLVFSLLSGIRRARDPLALVVDWTFTCTSGSVDLCTSLFSDCRHVDLFFVCLNFAVGLNREIITAKFSQSTVSYLTAVLATKPGEVTKLLHLITLYSFIPV